MTAKPAVTNVDWSGLGARVATLGALLFCAAIILGPGASRSLLAALGM